MDAFDRISFLLFGSLQNSHSIDREMIIYEILYIFYSGLLLFFADNAVLYRMNIDDGIKKKSDCVENRAK